ncbi:dTDP-4-dehydrorhamnose reductase family protein [Ramlibacter sp.]|uniref:dTDP-4-dehydrorhamnose reductase family protein n=1 Tax=Ramlibacter sp. TaxID=1917967 RepID=UPI003D13BD2C
MKVLVLGATGLLGNAVLRVLCEAGVHEVSGTARRMDAARHFTPAVASRLVAVNDIEDLDELERLFDAVRPDAVVNCVSVGKPLPADPMRTIALLSLLPQRLAALCARRGARLVQMGSDGVFTGAKGKYVEDDCADATDVYGVAKILGEVRDAHAVTIRASILGPELGTKHSLLEWFLAQDGSCRAFTRAIFSGLPTVVLARVIRDVILPRPGLHGIYHVAAAPISKYELLRRVAERYGKTIELVADDSVVIDRSLVARRFADATGFEAPGWDALVEEMHSYRYGLTGN